MPQLPKLPNGTWIDPSTVTKILPVPQAEYAGNKFDPYVTVFTDHIQIKLSFASFDDAKDYADSLAAIVNGARQ